MLLTDSQIKICSGCEIKKSFSEFTIRKKSKDGLNSYCKSCINLQRKNSFVKNKELRWKNQGIKTQEGLWFKWSDYLKLLALSGNKCMLCETTNNSSNLWCVDHDHKTGTVRFLLCHYCNRGIGFLKDSPALLRKASDMLEANKKESPYRGGSIGALTTLSP